MIFVFFFLLLCFFKIICSSYWVVFNFFNKDFSYYLEGELERDSTREHRGRRRRRLITEQGTWCGTQSQDPKTMTWAEGRRLTSWATQTIPVDWFLDERVNKSISWHSSVLFRLLNCNYKISLCLCRHIIPLKSRTLGNTYNSWFLCSYLFILIFSLCLLY